MPNKEFFYALVGAKPTETDKLVDRTDIIENDTTGNPLNPTPDPSIASINAKKLEVIAARAAAANGDREKIVILRQKCEELYDLNRSLAQQVDGIANGDRIIIESLGFVVGKLPENHGAPATNTIKSAEPTTPEYSVKLLLVKPLVRGILYDVRIGVNNASGPFNPDTQAWIAEFALNGMPSTDLVISGLTRKEDYVIQARGSDRGKKGNWSQPFFYTAR